MINDMLKKLVALQQKSYSPYSNFPVSAILIDESGNEFEGVNIENCSYGLTTCAERNAIANAIINGSRKIKEAHILCGRDNEIYGLPCGACRQVLSEFMDSDAKVYMWSNKGDYKVNTISELIPYAFNGSHLN